MQCRRAEDYSIMRYMKGKSRELISIRAKARMLLGSSA